MRFLRCCFFRPRHPAYLGVTHFGVGLKGNQRFETHSATWYLFGSYGNQLPLRDLEIQVVRKINTPGLEPVESSLALNWADSSMLV